MVDTEDAGSRASRGFGLGGTNSAQRQIGTIGFTSSPQSCVVVMFFAVRIGIEARRRPAATEKRQVVFGDLDLLSAHTKWFEVQFSAYGIHVGAILGDENPEGWAEDLAVPIGWRPNLRVIPRGALVVV